jgi:gluconolactonase
VLRCSMRAPSVWRCSLSQVQRAPTPTGSHAKPVSRPGQLPMAGPPGADGEPGELQRSAVDWAGEALNASYSQATLYVADSGAGTITAWDVAADGALSGARILASGMNTPDGTCVDAHGRLFVATWASTIEVIGADGYRWGRIPVPRQATNCAFGGDDSRSLFITAQESLYSHSVADPGLR